MSKPIANSWISEAPIYIAGKHGEDCIILSANENPLGASAKVKEVLRDFQLSRYPDGSCKSLREAIGSKHNLPSDRIACGAGSDELINLLVRCFACEHDEVLYSEHGFLFYPIAASLVGAKAIKVKESQYICDLEAMLGAITDRTRIIFIANPNNPTGSLLGRDALDFFIKRVPSHILIVLDAAYAEYVEVSDYDAGEMWALSYSNVVMLRTFSKLYGLASFRVGWMLGSAEIISTINRCRSPFNVSQSGQLAAIAALSDDEHIEASLASNRFNKLYFEEFLGSLGLVYLASHGNFVSVNFGSESTSRAVLEHLQGDNILVRDIGGYGMPNFLRITIGTKDEMGKLIKSLQVFYK